MKLCNCKTQALACPFHLRISFYFSFRSVVPADLTYGLIFVLRLSYVNPLNANPTKWSSTFKEFVGNLPTNCLSVFDHFVKLALKGLKPFNHLGLLRKPALFHFFVTICIIHKLIHAWVLLTKKISE